MVRRIEFLNYTNIIDISSAKVATIHEWQLHTSQELTIFFDWETQR